MKITVQNIASFGDDPQEIDLSKRIGIAYGWNGTGKTTLSNFLYQLNIENDESYKDCKVVKDDQHSEILVFNQRFVEDNFYNPNTQKGIFNLSRENKEIEEKIKKLTGQKEEKRKELEKKEEEKSNLNKNFQSYTEDIIKETWKIKQNYQNTSLSFCLEGFRNNGSNLFEHLLSKETANNISIEDLEVEYSSISEEAEKINEIPVCDKFLSLKEIEQDDIWSTKILGKKDSNIASLIKHLDNSDWVSQGEGYLTKEEVQPCPFCQQDIGQNIVQEINNYFDSNYKIQVTKIKTLEEKYKSIIKSIESAYQTESLDIYERFFTDSNFLEKIQSLVSSLKNNVHLIEEKKSNMSLESSLKCSDTFFQEFIKIVKDINLKIAEHNLRIQNKEKVRLQISQKFWEKMRWDYNDSIILYRSKKNDQKNKITNIENQTQILKKEIKDIIIEIGNQAKGNVNVADAVNAINTNLVDFGFTDFELAKNKEDNSYHLRRQGGGSNDRIFKTLSEGEKTIISFLYFIELCYGRKNKNEENKLKIVVIDDPISSLSHTHVFSICQIIKLKLLDEPNIFKKILVLSHSLYFCSELKQLITRGHHIKLQPNQQLEMYRFIKDENNKSKILPMELTQILNDYEAYWQVVKDSHHVSQNQSKPQPFMLANSMRNILEYFFGFVQKEELRDVLTQDKSFKKEAFYRFMNRESHSDRTNINDMNELDVSKFHRMFKEVFEKSDHSPHYNKMMKLG